MKRLKVSVSFLVSCCALFSVTVASAVIDPAPAQAVTWSEYQQKVNENEALKQKLSGVNQQLSQQIEALDDLNSHQIPAAQQALSQAQQQLDQAKSQVQSHERPVGSRPQGQGNPRTED